MSKSVSKSLTALKPMLPYGYQRKLEAKLSNSSIDIPLWRIKKAFAGRNQPEKILRKLFSEASKMSREHLKELKAAKKISKSLQAFAATVD